MRIALAFFGLPRNTRITFDSIRRNLMEPLAARGQLRVVYHFMQQDHVRNPASGEDHPLAPENDEAFSPFTGRTQRPEDCGFALRLRELQRFGDAWNDGFHSLRNLLMQLHCLREVTPLALEGGPDVVVFARPDLYYHDRLGPAPIERAADDPRALVLPGWQWWLGGYNDRFALCGREAARAYGRRGDYAMAFCRVNREPLHAEKLLRFAATQAQLKVHALGLRASRVRTHGAVAPELFNWPVRTSPPGP